jgi:hypothetical protein
MKRNLLIGLVATSILIVATAYIASKPMAHINKMRQEEGASMGEVCKHSIMTKLIDDLELRVLKSPSNSINVVVNGDDLLILIEYARQLEAVINMMDDDPSRARQLYKN